MKNTSYLQVLKVILFLHSSFFIQKNFFTLHFSLFTQKTLPIINYPSSPLLTAFSTERQCTDPASPYDGFNITHYTGDAPAHVATCRQSLCRQLGIDERHLILPRQVHGTQVAEVTADNLDDPFDGIDALVTTLPHTCIGISTADCVPVLLHDTHARVIAAIHAGWRGTVARIASLTVHYIEEHFGTPSSDLHAIIGPSIGPEAFEVGDEVYDAFRDAAFPINNIAFQRPARQHPEGVDRQSHTDIHTQHLTGIHSTTDVHTTADVRWHIDLWQANASDLIRAGVPADNIYISSLCTYSHPSRFFSARRLGIHSGRIYTGIMRA